MDPGKFNSDHVEFIDRRINEFDRRHDIYLKEKIEALEKLLNLTINTKSDALAVLISRLQSDNKDCAVRCAKQVQLFNQVISELKDKVKDYKIEELKQVVETLKADKEELETQVETLTKWKEGFWTRNITTTVVTATALVNIALYAFTWFVDYISKLNGMKGGPPTGL